MPLLVGGKTKTVRTQPPQNGLCTPRLAVHSDKSIHWEKFGSGPRNLANRTIGLNDSMRSHFTPDSMTTCAPTWPVIDNGILATTALGCMPGETDQILKQLRYASESKVRLSYDKTRHRTIGASSGPESPLTLEWSRALAGNSPRTNG